MIKLLLNFSFILLLACTGGGDTAFYPENPTTIEEHEESLYDPVIDSVSVTPGNYIGSQVINFTVSTLKKSYIIGTPSINFNLGGSNYTADYIGSSDNYAHDFIYTVGNNLLDLDGIVLSSPINLNGGTFKDILANDFSLDFSIPNTSTVRIDSIAPSLISVGKPADNLYIVGDQLNFTANFNDTVFVSGSPRIPITINSGTVYANYLSGSGTSNLVFQLTVNSGNDDNDGIVLSSSIDLSSGNIQDNFGNNSSLNFTPPNTSAITLQPYGNPTKVTFTTQPSTPNTRDVDFGIQPVITIQDASNNTVLNATDIITLLPFTDSTCTTAAGGTLNSNSLAATSGTASFSGVDYNALGTIYIRASTGGLTSDCSNAVLIQLLSPTKVVFSIYPGATATSGTDFPVQPVVQVQDVNSSVVTTASNLIIIDAFTDNSCSIAAVGTLNSNSQSASSGVATFSGMNYTKSETIYLRASSGTLASDCEAVAINIAPGAATKILFTTYPGTPYNEDTDFEVQPVVEIRDSFDNLANSTATVTINAHTNDTCSSAAPGVLTSNSIAAVAGVANFSGMDYDTPETIYLEATSAGLTSDCQNIAIVINDITPPANPTVLAIDAIWVTGASPSSPGLTWVNPVDSDFQKSQAALGDSIGATNIVDYQDTDAATSHDFNSLFFTECSQTYYSSVRALDTLGNPSNGANMVSGFKYDNTIPTNPAITFVFNDHNATDSSNIQWTASTDNCGLDHYEMAVSLDTTEANIIAGGGWTNLGNVTSGQLTGLTLTLGQSYRTLLRAHDEAGLRSAIIPSAAWTYVLPPDPITDLAASQISFDQVELSWTEPVDNGSAITDYIVEFRTTSPVGSWQVFNDGINTDHHLFVTGLTASTEYDFRVKASNGSGATPSNIITAETLPNIPFFNGKKAFNLGGAVDSVVVALKAGTEIKRNGAVLVNLVNKGDTHRFVSAPNDILEGDNEFYVAGRAGNTAACGGSGNIVWSIKDWAGKNFLFDGTRNGPHKLIIRTFEAATVDVYRGGVIYQTQTLPQNTNHTFTITPNDQYEISSSGIIVAYVYSGAFIDSYPLLPSRRDLIGVPSNGAYFQIAGAPTNYNRWLSNANSPTAGTFSNTALNSVGGSGGQFSGDALRVIADDPIAGHSRADSDGCQSAPFLPRALMRRNYAVNVVSEWVKFVSDKPTIITRTNPGGATSTFTLTKTGSAPESLYHIRLTNVAAGTVFEAPDRMGVWYEPNTTAGAAVEDETLLFGWDY